MAPKTSQHSLQVVPAPKSAKDRKALLKVVDDKLVDLERGLGETVEAIDRGDVDIADLDWEGEFASRPADDSNG